MGYPLMPELDRTPEGIVKMFQNNMHYVSSLALYQQLQCTGGFDTDHKARMRAKRRRSGNWTQWKESQYEAFWGQKLEAKPASDAEVEKWRELDLGLLQSASAVLGDAVLLPSIV